MCETSGFQGLFRSDHYSTGEAGRDPDALDAWLVLAALATVTSVIRLGTLVSPVTFRHPAVLAKSTVTVDHISGGWVRVAARWADEYNTTATSAQECRRRRKALDEACEREGRDPASLRFSVMTGFLTGTSPAEVGDHASRVARRLCIGCDAREWMTLMSAEWLVGTTDELVTQVAAYEAAGVNRLMLQHHAFDDLDLLELVGREIIPRVTRPAADFIPPLKPAAAYERHLGHYALRPDRTAQGRH